MPDADLLREMIGCAAERPMELDVGAATGAGYSEKHHFDLHSATAIEIATERPRPASPRCARLLCSKKCSN